MKMIQSLSAAAALACAIAAVPATAATPIVSSGKLMGATGVTVGGASYDVAFLDGTCSGVFGGCTTGNFSFTTLSSALAAGNALLSQVFLNGKAGAFDTHPALTAGCTSAVACNVLIPFAASDGVALVTDTVNMPTTSLDFTFASLIGSKTSTASLASFVYAKFTPSVTTAVPEPATWAMMLAGFGLMGAALRYRKRSTKLTLA
ncbi:PEPxxWA-CTERM sorting domain-containing protein [Sphingomonas sp. CARO-RG-8B-R24-01]|uniref:PEPxxWA-CTERM sorting domain-containing protein n=1 Tax=Sphingomonas sp. CARO-RG-8B-R24-01 TaxID=2914831 RepID=UPI001F5A2A0F|nr:PEPxxWA-CTERM sorting domain-containing protein [Sphingomonas sp. CARO-RG-8B-R24-01]